MATDLHAIAVAVANTLSELNPEISYSPEYDLSDLASKKCVIVPSSINRTPICRNSKIVEITAEIEVGILHRGKKLNVANLVSEVQFLATQLKKVRVGNSQCIKVDHEPLYDAEQLRQRNQFTSVLALTFKEIAHDG